MEGTTGAGAAIAVSIANTHLQSLLQQVFNTLANITQTPGWLKVLQCNGISKFKMTVLKLP